MKKNHFLAFVFSTIGFLLFAYVDGVAQSGKMAGQVIDAKSGEELIGATVQVQGTSHGTITDINGNYQLSLEPDSYDIQVSYVSYAPQTIQGVEIKANEVTNIDVALEEESQELQEVVVQAAAIKDNDVALLKIQKNALAVQDGISSREMTQLGVSNAAESMKQVTGASVENGKYVVMRGLGDRYSITQLNGVTMPSADPYRNSTSMDLVPADMIDNIVTVKTYTPDQPGNFTGGKVDITTKSLPDEFYLNLGVSSTYNTQSSLIGNFLSEGGKGGLDFLGYDDGSRNVPAIWNQYRSDISNPAVVSGLMRQGRSPQNEEPRNILDQTSKALNIPFVAPTESTPLNYGIDFSVGNRLSLFGRNLGYNLGVNFDRNYTFYNNGVFGTYASSSGGEVTQLNREQRFDETSGMLDVRLGGLFSLAYQFSPNHEITLSNLYNHSNAREARVGVGFWSSTGQPFYEDRYSEFQERALNNTQMQGKHLFSDLGGLKLDWTLGYVRSSQDEPDIRLFGFTRNRNNTPILNQSEVGFLPSHFYRFLTDQQYSAKFDFTLPFTENKGNALKFGFNYSNKQRDFDELIFSYVSQTPGISNPSYIPFSRIGQEGVMLQDFFAPGNVGIVDTPESSGTGIYGFGNVYADITKPENSYIGEEIITAGYLMANYSLTPALKVVGGARLEVTNLGSESKLAGSGSGKIKTTDILPALNIIYQLSENTNLRGAVSQTLARPNMREISPFAAVGGVAYPIFLGNPDLDRTLIQNYDLRYETYPHPGELLAISAYYKNFHNPIVQQLTAKATTPEIKPVNVDQATVFGAEVEVRKSLDFITPVLANFKISANASYIYSKVDKSEQELQALKDANRPDLKHWRPFQGQSPYIVNASLLYANPETGLESSLSFNIWGERLAFITDALTPDVYEQPRPSLNFNISKSVNDHLSFRFKADNLFNMEYLQKYDFEGDYIYKNYTVGRSFTLGVSYHL